MFNPIFQSHSHGYDTIDYYTIDNRLGDNKDFKYVSSLLHKNGIRIILDAVFNHVGRGFFAFEDVLKIVKILIIKTGFTLIFMAIALMMII